MLNLLPLNLWNFLQAEYTKDLMSFLISEFQTPTFYFPKFNHLSSLLPETCYLSLRASPLTFYNLFNPLQPFPGFSHCLPSVLPRGCTICRDRSMREEDKAKAAAQHRQNPRSEGSGKSLWQVVRIFVYKVKALTFGTYFSSEERPLATKRQIITDDT